MLTLSHPAGFALALAGTYVLAGLLGMLIVRCAPRLKRRSTD